MKKEKFIKIIIVLIFLLLVIAALVVTYFFNSDVETKEPKKIEDECEIQNYEYNERKVFVIKPKEKTSNKYVLYLHGGSYVAEATENHWNFIERIVKDTNTIVIMPDYPLTPKYNYKDVYNMVEPLYKDIIQKVGKDNLILAGDSAGGGLALGIYESMAEENIDLPIKTMLISPWLDVKLDNENIKQVEKNDPILNKETLKIAGIAYSGSEGTEIYKVSPIKGDLTKLKNIKIFIGTRDILNPDCKLLQEKAPENEVEIREYENAKHIWLIDNNSDKEITQKAYEDFIEQINNS